MVTAVAGHRLPHCWRDDSTGLGLRSGNLFRLDVQTMTVVGCAPVGSRWSRSGGRLVIGSGCSLPPWY